MQVRHSHVERRTLVLNIHLSLNLVALTLDAVIGKHKKLLVDQWTAFRAELHTALRCKAGQHPNKWCARRNRLIVGKRHSKGSGFRDHLCAEEFNKLGNAEKAMYREVAAPVDDAVIFSNDCSSLTRSCTAYCLRIFAICCGTTTTITFWSPLNS